MRTNILRHVAVALGLSFVVAHAQAGEYNSPAKWNNFNTQKQNTPVFRTVAGNMLSDAAGGEHSADAVNSASDVVTDDAPMPVLQGTDSGAPCVERAIIHPAPTQSVMASPTPTVAAPCNNPKGGCYPNPTVYSTTPGTHVPAVPQTYYNHVPSCTTSIQPIRQLHGAIGSAIHNGNLGNNIHGALAGNRAGRNACSISPWFGGTNIFFLDIEDEHDHAIFIDDTNAMPVLSFSDVDPTDSTAFDVHFGRYLDNGCMALDFRFFRFDPDEVSARATPGAPTDYRAYNQAWNQLNYTSGAFTNVYDQFDSNVQDVRVSRDLEIQGFEANLVSFGRMGSRRLGAGCNQGLGRGYGLGSKLGMNTACGRYGGIGGPLSNPCGRVQVSTSHGFRWFQVEDALEIAGDLVGTPAGYGPDDLYVNIDVDNNLYGYQFGSNLSYCLNCHWLFNVGAKVGLYANDVEFRQRIGSDTTYATTSFGGADINTSEEDTVFAALCELDLGLTYRFSNAWSVQGGYRLLAAGGIATATGSVPNDYSRLDRSSGVYADDSLILHGGYIGLNYNW